ncbi:hypothetical protein [Variovorax sp. UC122_21]|uniref:hypothetical protein n=1 Tax=Variovorax sp. UC122_21 TaxID=3374554 RepID=UPI003756FF76
MTPVSAAHRLFGVVDVGERVAGGVRPLVGAGQRHLVGRIVVARVQRDRSRLVLTLERHHVLHAAHSVGAQVDAGHSFGFLRVLARDRAFEAVIDQ